MRATLLFGGLGCLILLLGISLITVGGSPQTPHSVERPAITSSPTPAADDPAVELRTPLIRLKPAASDREAVPNAPGILHYTAIGDGDCIVQNEGSGIPVFRGELRAIGSVPSRRLVATLFGERDGALHQVEEQAFQVDRDGSFIVGFESEPDLRLDHRLEITYRTASGRPQLGWAATLDASLMSGLTSLGEIALDLPRRIAAGRVVNDGCNALEGARVTLWRRTGGDLLLEHGPWLVDPALYAVSDRDGSFELLDWGESSAFGLQASHAGFMPTALKLVSHGSEHLEFGLQRLSDLRGNLLVPDGLTQPLFEVSLRRVHSDVDARGLQPKKPPGPEYEFSWKSLPPGKYHLEVRFAGADSPIHMSTLQLQPGSRRNVGLCDDIDVRHAVKTIRLTVLDPDGRPVPSGKVTLNADSFQPEMANLPRSFPIQNGRALIVTTRAYVTVDVHVAGYRSLAVPDLGGEQTVSLEGGIPVRLRLTDRSVVPEPPYALRAELEPESPGITMARPRLSDAEVFDQSGEERLRVPSPGRYRVRWRLVDQSDEFCRSYPLEGAPDATIEVPEHGDPSVFDLELPAASTLLYRGP